MAKENANTAATAQVANPFENAATIAILKPKTKPFETFIYRGFDDLEKLIKYVGSRPALNPDLSLQFKKAIVKPNSVIIRNSFGEVVRVMTFEEAAENYDIAASSSFVADRDSNKVEAKPVKARKSKKD